MKCCVTALLCAVVGLLAFTTAPALAAGPPEKPETGKAGAITTTTATLEGGVLNPNATTAVEGGEYQYRYNVSATECEGGLGAPEPASFAAGMPKEAVPSVDLKELQPHAKYTFCLIERNSANEVATGTPVTFETEAAPPTVESEGASSVKATEAHLEATVNPNNQSTVCSFQYGAEPSLTAGTTSTLCEPGALAASFGGQGVGLTVTGLEAHKTYYYRVLATNATGEEKGTIKHFETAIAPETPEKEEAEPIGTTTATLNGVLNPNNAGEAGTYEFAYRQSAGECRHENPETHLQENEKATAPEPSSTTSPQPVSAPVTELLPGTQYTFCLIAHNSVGETAVGSPVTFTTLAAAPMITSEFAAIIEETSVALHAQIDADGAATSYHFEYGTGETYGQSTPETALPESGVAEAALEGLQPGTTYHYRVVATNSHSPAGGTDGPDKTFTTNATPTTIAETCPNGQLRAEQPYGLTLPDCRAYEMVSPLEKGDQGVLAVDARASVSSESPAIGYLSTGAFAEPKSAKEVDRYISRREPNGWSTQNVTPAVIPQTQERAPFAESLFTPELSEGLLLSENVPLIAGEPEGYFNLYLANFADQSYRAITSAPAGVGPYTENAGEGAVEVAFATPDLSHVLLQRYRHVYEWAGGKLSQIDIPPEGVTFPSSAYAGAPGGAGEADKLHAMSEDGQRVFFTATDTTQNYGAGQLYMRENPASPVESCAVAGDACTLEVSASQRTKPNGEPNPDPYNSDPKEHGAPYPAWYRDASADGSHVFFTSQAELTNEADTGPDDSAPNLYEYDVETGKLTDLTVDKTDSDGAGVLGLVTAGENLGDENSYLYFVANGVLSKSANSQGENATPGTCEHEPNEITKTGERTCNLYVMRYEGEKWEQPKFIAKLAGSDKPERGGTQDEPDWFGEEGQYYNSYDFGPLQHTVRVTPDGVTLAFESERDLTSYDNEQAEPEECEGIDLDPAHSAQTGRCYEQYVYNAVSEKLVCASCDPSGARPVGPSELGGREDEAGFLHPSPSYLPRDLSENGRRLFFQTADALVPYDVNGRLDVYEWEEQGEGSCQRFSGCVFPISYVAGNYESKFLDASANGEDVFIDTQDQLVPADTDTRTDVYDARVGGGLPVPASPPECDNADACKPPVSAQPSVFGAPASATFAGAGNPAPPPPSAVVKPKPTKKTVKCKKGFVKNKKGKCIKSKKKPKKAKKSTKGRK